MNETMRAEERDEAVEFWQNMYEMQVKKCLMFGIDQRVEAMSEYIVEFGDRPINDDNKYIHERVVRCRDCRWFDSSTEPYLCYRLDHSMFVEPSGFCAWGEMMEL